MTADIFTQARSAKLFKPEPIAQETLDTLIEWVKWSPSESNSWPFRVVFVQSESAKAREKATDRLRVNERILI